MPDTGEFIAENAVSDSVTSTNRTLLRELAATYDELVVVINMTHQAHHMHERGSWETCHMATCRRVQSYINGSIFTKEKEK
jgi:hypothetical protein